jgi:eukaryotic-like serine/threonine-protein kinase
MAGALQLGRYSVFAELASGGMATVYLGRMSGAVGFGRTVAIKRLHPHLSRDPEFVSMFLDEARLAARVQHPNVVPTLDVVTEGNELFLVFEYIKGETLGGLLRAARKSDLPIPVPVTVAIVVGILNGLHAAHEAKDEQGAHLHIVHRDVSPQNVIVGSDGVARVLDFGVAKATSRLQTTRDGQIKGKISYMAPEQIAGQATRRSDIYAAGVVLWEALALSRLFVGENDAQLLHSIIAPKIEPPSRHNAGVSPALDRIVMQALSADPAARFATAREMAEALDACMRPASANQVAEWLESMAGPALRARSEVVAEIESHSGNTGRSEVRKLIELGPAALLAGESGPQLKRVSGPPGPGSGGTGSSVTVASASVSLTPRASSSSRSWMLVLGGAVLIGTLVGVGFLVARGSRGGSAASPVINATVASPETTTAKSPEPPPTTPPIAASSAPPIASESPTPSPGATATHPKKPPVAGTTTKTKAPSGSPGDIDSLLDSH